jgi:transposase InsO family protein
MEVVVADLNEAGQVKFGIRHERIEAGHPEQNGRHERMHRTLKQETLRPPAASLRSRQARFDMFHLEYNEGRPHEALGDDVPASRYAPAYAWFAGWLRLPTFVGVDFAIEG